MMEDSQVKYVAKGTARAIDNVVSKYYADCFNTEADMHRLMLWEKKLCDLTGIEYPYRGVTPTHKGGTEL